MHEKYKRSAKKSHPGLNALLVMLALGVVAALLMGLSVFVVRDIRIVGTIRVSPQDVILQSGLRQGESVFGLDTDAVRERVNAHKLLYFESLDITFPSTVTLRVRERAACAQIEYLGFLYAIDETGRVLYKSAALEDASTLPLIEGISIVSIYEGGEVVLEDASQLLRADAVLDALGQMGMIGVAHELNVSDSENLYIMTQEDTKVELGDETNLVVKLAIAQEILRDQGDRPLRGAKIDVSSGMDGYFIPSERKTD